MGIHYVLCSKLRQFSYEEIEFFLPQLCHLLVSIDNESMALEEFIIDLCEESVNGALLVSLGEREGDGGQSLMRCRRSGSSKHICTTFPHNPPRMPFKYVGGYTIKCNG